MYKQPIWFVAIGHLLGLLGLTIGITMLIQGSASLLWTIPWITFHFINSLMVSVGLHRYFAHGQFKTNKFWHVIMAWWSVILLQGSTLAWAAAHNTHHTHSDTDKDPHKVDLSYLIWKQYNNVPMEWWRVKHLVKDWHIAFTHRYGTPLWLAFCTVFLLVSPKAFLFCYLMPLGGVHLIGAIHQVTSHTKKTGPRNIPILEYILPACGEWNHRIHHLNPLQKDFRSDKWNLDFGYKFMQLISK